MGKTLLDDRGRITIPLEIRESLRLRPGMAVEVARSGEAVVVRRVLSAKEAWKKLKGCINERNALEPLDPMEVKRIWHASD